MKKKHLRTAVIAAMILLLAATTILHLKIEPANAPAQSLPTAGSLADSDELSNPSQADTIEQSIPPVPETPAEESSAETTNSAPAQASTENTLPAAPALSDTSAETPEAAPAQHLCTLEIRCDTVKDTSKLENEAVIPYIPADGVILPVTEVSFTPGESVFDVLLRTTRATGIQMEFRDDALYSGKYIEGIHYLYEFDGGPLSGWMYKVNEQFPNYGCAAYTVQDNDAIVWMYTCDLGVDVGDNSVW